MKINKQNKNTLFDKYIKLADLYPLNFDYTEDTEGVPNKLEPTGINPPKIDEPATPAPPAPEKKKINPTDAWTYFLSSMQKDISAFEKNPELLKDPENKKKLNYYYGNFSKMPKNMYHEANAVSLMNRARALMQPGYTPKFGQYVKDFDNIDKAYDNKNISYESYKALYDRFNQSRHELSALNAKNIKNLLDKYNKYFTSFYNKANELSETGRTKPGTAVANSINNIVKKASLYEKLCLFGRRDDFIKSLAQSSMSPQESLDYLKRAIGIINSVVDNLGSNYSNYSLPLTSTADDVEQTYSNLAAEINKLIRSGTSQDKARLLPILNSLTGAKSNIDLSRQWKRQQEESYEQKVLSPDYIAADPSQYGELVQKSQPTAIAPATDPVSVFNFYFTKLQKAEETDNLKDMMSYMGKLQGAINSLQKTVKDDNPYSDENIMITDGSNLIKQVQQKLYMQK